MNPDQLANSSGNLENITPMMRQYMTQKKLHPDALLLFRMGDFYEMFLEDAVRASQILNITLTSRDRNKANSIPMCGFPHHSSSSYITKLLAAGERVAICDQIENPKVAKGLVKREVTRIVTPGLVDDSEVLNSKENHFICALSQIRDEIGIATLDLSTGEFIVTSTTRTTLASQELRRVNPKEILIQKKLNTGDPLNAVLSDDLYVHELDTWSFDPPNCSESLKEHFGVQSLSGFGLEDRQTLVSAAGALIQYVSRARSEKPHHIKAPRVYSLDSFMVLDQSTLRNLEIFRNLRDGLPYGALISVLDRTKTPMGARLLRKWISYPLLDVDEIRKRSNLTKSFVENFDVRREIRNILTNFGDLERLAGRISLKTVTPRDLVQLRVSSEKIPKIIGHLRTLGNRFGVHLSDMDDLSYVAHAVESVIVDNPPASITDGGVIRPGYKF